MKPNKAQQIKSNYDFAIKVFLILIICLPFASLFKFQLRILEIIGISKFWQQIKRVNKNMFYLRKSNEQLLESPWLLREGVLYVAF